MLDIRVSCDRAVNVIGRKGDKCTHCQRMTAEYVFWKDDTTMVYVCTYCQIGLEIQPKPDHSRLLEPDELD